MIRATAGGGGRWLDRLPDQSHIASRRSPPPNTEWSPSAKTTRYLLPAGCASNTAARFAAVLPFAHHITVNAAGHTQEWLCHAAVASGQVRFKPCVVGLKECDEGRDAGFTRANGWGPGSARPPAPLSSGRRLWPVMATRARLIPFRPRCNASAFIPAGGVISSSTNRMSSMRPSICSAVAPASQPLFWQAHPAPFQSESSLPGCCTWMTR